MKKKSIILSVVILAVLFVMFISAYAVFDQLFPKAAAINTPEKESVAAITIVRNDGSSVDIAKAEHERLLQTIAKAQSTRKMSINDHPSEKEYYTIKAYTPGKEFYYYAYTGGSEAYIEIPYEGVYKTDKQFLASIEDYFKD